MCLCYIEKKETGIGTQTTTHLNNGLHILTSTPLITLCPSPSPLPTSKLHTLQFQLKQATGRRLCISCSYSLCSPHSCPETHLHGPHSQSTATAKSLQSCPTLCDPIDGSPPGSPIPGILQARTLEWVAISFSNALK